MFQSRFEYQNADILSEGVNCPVDWLGKEKVNLLFLLAYQVGFYQNRFLCCLPFNER